jgi:glycosyltransferase involved in cell wall biosynthesis
VTESGDPLVTVSIPVFNGLPYIQETLASVKNQTFSNVEIVIVDGGSDAPTLDFLHSIGDSISHIEFLPRGTPVALTWSRSCALAQGNFIKLLCQDDVLYPEAIQSQVDFLLAHGDADLVFSKRDIIDANQSVVAKDRGGISGSSRVLDGRQALRFGYLAGANIYGEPEAVMFRRLALMNQLPWNSSIPYLIDMEMYARVMLSGRVGYLDETVGAFRISSQSWSTRLTGEQTQQFRAWQRWVSDALGDVTAMEQMRARLNATRVSWTRTAAYAWLRLRGGFS